MAIRWLDSDRPDWADMTVTSNLDDGSTGTSESASDASTIATSGTCLVAPLSAILTAESRQTNAQSLTAWRARGTFTIDTLLTESNCVIDEEGPVGSSGSAGAELEYWDGAAWQSLDSVSLSVPSVVFASPSSLSFDTTARSISATISCRFRVVLTFSYTFVGSHNTITITNAMSEWTLTQTDTGQVCDSGEGTGGGGSGGDGDEECTCAWTLGTTTCASWTAGSDNATVWTKGGCS